MGIADLKIPLCETGHSTTVEMKGHYWMANGHLTGNNGQMSMIFSISLGISEHPGILVSLHNSEEKIITMVE